MSHDNRTAYIVDGMALLQALDESKFDTFNDLGTCREADNSVTAI